MNAQALSLTEKRDAFKAGYLGAGGDPAKLESYFRLMGFSIPVSGYDDSQQAVRESPKQVVHDSACEHGDGWDGL